MSAALVILPVVWATESYEEESFDSFPLRSEPTGRRAKGAKEDTGILHCVQDDDEEQTTSERCAAGVCELTPGEEETTEAHQAPPEMAFYRKYTEAMLRRYMTMSTESGRVPSLLGREMFRGRVTNCTMHGFDDVVIFVHDVTRCLELLTEGQRYLIRRIALQEYTQIETAATTGIPLRTVHRRYARALDMLTEIFLERRLLEPRMACHEAGSVRY